MRQARVITISAILATAFALAFAGSAGAATSSEATSATQPYPLKNSERFVVQGRRESSARTKGRPACVIPPASLSLAPHQRALLLRELAFDPRSCRVKYERGVPPRSAEESASQKAQKGDSQQARSAGAGGRVSASGSAYRHAGYVKAWYWDTRARRIINSVRSGASWTGGSCVGPSNTWFRTYADVETGWRQVSRRWSRINDRCDYLVSSTNAAFRDRNFTGCTDGPVVDTSYTRVRFVGYPDGNGRGSRSSRVEPTCPDRLRAWFAIYRGTPPPGP